MEQYNNHTLYLLNRITRCITKRETYNVKRGSTRTEHKINLNKTLAKRLLELKEGLLSSGVQQAEMTAHTAKRLESVRLFSCDRVCLKSAQPLSLIESA